MFLWVIMLRVNFIYLNLFQKGFLSLFPTRLLNNCKKTFELSCLEKFDSVIIYCKNQNFPNNYFV